MKVSKKVLLGLSIALGVSTVNVSCTKGTLTDPTKGKEIQTPITNENPNNPSGTVDNCPACGMG